MAQPTPTDVHTDAILTNISTAYMQRSGAYIASQVFPFVPVSKQSDVFYTYTKGDWFRDEAQLRAPATESAGGGYTLSTDSYSALVYAFHKDIDDQVRANADSPINLDREATEFVTQRMLMKMEKDWISTFFGTGVWGTDNSSATDWDNYSSSNPLDDIETARRTILANTGFKPNTMVIGYDVFRYLKHHPDIIDRVKYTSSENVTTALLSRLFEVDRILVCEAIENTGAEGASDSFGFMYGKHALLCYTPSSPGLLTPAAGYTFVWQGVSDGMGTNVGITRMRMPFLRADRVEAQMAWDHKVIGSDLGYFFSGIVS